MNNIKNPSTTLGSQGMINHISKKATGNSSMCLIRLISYALQSCCHENIISITFLGSSLTSGLQIS